MQMPAVLVVLALSASACTSAWTKQTHGKCGPEPVVAPAPAGRWDDRLQCVVTAEVERDCAARPPAEAATIVNGRFGGGALPSECDGHRSQYEFEHGARFACACMTPEEIERESTRP